MSGPSYAVTQEYEGYRIRETTQREGEGMLVTHDWLKATGLGPPTRMNIQDIVNAAIYNHEGGAFLPVDMNDVYSGRKRAFPRKFAIDGLRKSGLVIARR